MVIVVRRNLVFMGRFWKLGDVCVGFVIMK